MSVIDTIVKEKKHVKRSDGYHPVSQWTSSDTVEMPNGKTLSENTVELTQAEYDALSDTKNTDGVDYYTTDTQKHIRNGIEYGGSSTSTEVDSTLSVEGAAADAKVTGDAITELRGLFNSINMQYLNSTEVDTVQLKDAEGVWHDWKSGGLGRVYIYNEGYINTALVGNLVQGGNTSDSLTDKSPVFNPTTISLPTTSSSECTVRTNSTVDITNYKELGVCIVEGLVKKEFTLDISEVSGSLYLGIRQTFSSNTIKAQLAVSNNTSFYSSNMQAYTRFRDEEVPTDENKTCIISQMWLK